MSPETQAAATAEAEVREVNQKFYQALESLDLEAMEGVWLHHDLVRCVHPGWPMLAGWEPVRESWEEIFRNTESMLVSTRDLALHIEGGVGWVTCTERVTSKRADRSETALVQATNLFLRRDGEWKMVLHHASPLALPGYMSPSETVH
jgi:ketosteroid isomerase-like protein